MASQATMTPSKETRNNSSGITISLLSRAHSPTSTARIYSEKIKHRPLHLAPTPSASSNSQQQRRLTRLRKLQERKKKQKPSPLSARAKRALGIYTLPKAGQKYEIYQPLHEMWIGYVREVLSLDGGEEVGKLGPVVTAATAAKLCSADFHGAELEVVRSRCVSRVGVRGIVVKDSRFVFEIVTRGNAVKVVPKEHTVFRFSVPLLWPGTVSKLSDEVVEKQGKKGEQLGKKNEEEKMGRDLVFELHGDQFQYRASDRANRKFKTHFLPDL